MRLVHQDIIISARTLGYKKWTLEIQAAEQV